MGFILVRRTAAAGRLYLCLAVTVLAGCMLWDKPASPSMTGTLRYSIVDGDTGRSMPGRITLVPARNTRRPKLSPADIGERSGGSVVVFNRILSATGRGRVRVPYGRYHIYASRGPEWTMHLVNNVEITDAGADFEARLRRVVDTSGWISADFHVHAAPSWDSNVPMEYRVIEFMAEGVELIVGTDHNVITDYAPTIEELGAEEYIGSLAGDEVSTWAWGHFGVFPLPRSDAGKTLGVEYRTSRAGKILPRLREAHPESVIQVNHPTGFSKTGYFRQYGYQPRTDRARIKGFSFEFDAVEVFSGLDAPRRDLIDSTIRAWLQLIAHGHRVTATGNSDTHRLSSLAGYPRNYLRVGIDRPTAVTDAEIVDAIRHQRVLVSTAPFISARIGKARTGDLATVSAGVAELDIEVQAAPWVSLSRVRVLVNGVREASWSIEPNATTVKRFVVRHPLRLTRDAFVVVRVDGDRPMWPIIGEQGRFAVYPFAMTNPIFVDVDGNAQYDPPAPHGHR